MSGDGKENKYHHQSPSRCLTCSVAMHQIDVDGQIRVHLGTVSGRTSQVGVASRRCFADVDKSLCSADRQRDQQAGKVRCDTHCRWSPSARPSDTAVRLSRDVQISNNKYCLSLSLRYSVVADGLFLTDYT